MEDARQYIASTTFIKWAAFEKAIKTMGCKNLKKWSQKQNIYKNIWIHKIGIPLKGNEQKSKPKRVVQKMLANKIKYLK